VKNITALFFLLFTQGVIASGASSPGLPQPPEAALASFDRCSKSDIGVVRLAQRVGDKIGLRKASPEAVLRGWFKQFQSTHAPDTLSNRLAATRSIRASIETITPLTETEIETLLIQLIDSTTASHCLSVRGDLLQATSTQIIIARYWLIEMENVLNILVKTRDVEKGLRKLDKLKDQLDQQKKNLFINYTFQSN